MTHELKKIWRPINFVVILITIIGTMWNLYGDMYGGAPFLRNTLIMAWTDVLDNDDPLGYAQDKYSEIDDKLTELQIAYMFSDSAEEKEGSRTAIRSIVSQEGIYSNSLPFDLMVLSRIKTKMEYINGLEDTWENEKAILTRTIKRKGYENAEAQRLTGYRERYSNLSVPKYQNIGPYEDFAKWNTAYAYIILLPIIWIVAQSIPIEKKTGMRELICSVAKSPQNVAVSKAVSTLVSACIVVSVQFLAGLGIAVYMAGGAGGLTCEIQALYGMDKCYLGMPIYMLLCCQLVMQNVLAIFAAGCTMLITAFLQDEWQSLPIVVVILITPNILYSVFPEAEGLDIASITGVIKPLANNSAAPAFYAAGALALTALMSAYTCHHFVRKSR